MPICVSVSEEDWLSLVAREFCVAHNRAIVHLIKGSGGPRVLLYEQTEAHVMLHLVEYNPHA